MDSKSIQVTPTGNQQPGNENDARSEQSNRLYQTAVLLIYGKRRSVDKAIKCVQKAITFNDSDYKYWQLLGEAYYQRGSLNPAINCFMKSLTLAENHLDEVQPENNRRRADCIQSRLRMSDIRLFVGHLDEAASGYNDIIDNDPSNVGALVGLSKTEFQLARNSFSSGLVNSGHNHCMIALKYALKAIKQSPHLALTWKLASDCCLIQFIHGQRKQFLFEMKEEFPGSEDDRLVITRKVCIDLAEQFLCKALNIEPFYKSSCLWHNLGISLYLKSTIELEANAQTSILKRSLKCLLKSLDLDRENSQIRNSIGVVSARLNYLDTSQHFFITSIQTNLSTSETQFSNLGYVFLEKGLFDLSREVFARCQAEEPLYSRSWLGNALVNDQLNLDNLSLLRHCHRLENNYESQMLYATKVTSLACSLDYKKDLVSALDCMTRTIEYDDSSIEANNTMGLLYERSGYQDQAMIYFDRAYNLCNRDPRIIFNRLRQIRVSGDCCPLNSSKFERESDIVKQADKLITYNKEHLLNYIYYLFVNGDFKAVNTKMSRLMEKLNPSDVRSKTSAQILLGLAAKAENNDFKSWLFKNIIDLEGVICIEALINLFCLMLLGASVEDYQLVDQIASDLANYLLAFLSSRQSRIDIILQSLDGQWIRLILFASLFCLRDRDKLINQMLCLFPTVADLWFYLGLSMMLDGRSSDMAKFCLEKASLLGSGQSPDLVFVCDILSSILDKTKQTACSNQRRVTNLCRALYKYPNYGILRSTLQNIKLVDEDSLWQTDEKFAMIQLAMNHTIRMIFT